MKGRLVIFALALSEPGTMGGNSKIAKTVFSAHGCHTPPWQTALAAFVRAEKPV